MHRQRRALIVPTTYAGTNSAGALVVGTTTSNVLRWPNTITASDAYITVTDSATLGTVFTLRAPGIWLVQLALLCVAGASLIGAIALNGAPAAGSVLPVGTAGVRRRQQVTCAALTTSSLSVSDSIYLSDAAVGQELRAVAADAAGATPIPSISATANVNTFSILRSTDAA